VCGVRHGGAHDQGPARARILSYNALRFAARRPGLVGAVVTYNDVWAGDPAMAYDRIWAVYRTIVEQFGTTGLGARMLAGSYGVS
jgi:hypothetical protein